MKTRAKIAITLELDPDEFYMPADGDPTEELTDIFNELLEHVDGANVRSLRLKCTGKDYNA
mgnify:FL=1